MGTSNELNALGEEQREAQPSNYMSASATGQIQYRGFHNPGPSSEQIAKIL
jgi:hypothetical protein